MSVFRGAANVALTGVGAAEDGFGDVLGEALTEGLGDGAAGEELSAVQAGGVSMTVGAERATGGVCRVVPTTYWTVASTAVTLAAVHDSHMSR
ncbi:hypothetical protein [Streptomyces sp. NPDC031705]|uniref:hypothetical protein n=1 Tax=Streptomyces sp. NPDC031705 TaxID=3155729 RepID=UPI0033E6E1D7